MKFYKISFSSMTEMIRAKAALVRYYGEKNVQIELSYDRCSLICYGERLPPTLEKENIEIEEV